MPPDYILNKKNLNVNKNRLQNVKVLLKMRDRKIVERKNITLQCVWGKKKRGGL